MYTYEIYEIENGYGFRILYDSNPIIVQDYKPDVDGFVIMTQEEAINCAEIVLTRMVA